MAYVEEQAGRPGMNWRPSRIGHRDGIREDRSFPFPHLKDRSNRWHITIQSPPFPFGGLEHENVPVILAECHAGHVIENVATPVLSTIDRRTAFHLG